MASPSDAGGGARFSHHRHLAKRLEKSNFAQTCSLLSQFLKEKRGLGLADLSPDKTAKKKPRDELEKPKPPPATTISLPTNTANSSDTTRQKDSLPKFVGFPPSGFSNNATNKGEFRRPATPEPATAQMTIFYAGKVLVYDDFPNERAKEIMAMADKGSRSANTTAAPAATVAPNIYGSAHTTCVEKPSSGSLAGEPNAVPKTPPAGPIKSAPEQQLKAQAEAKNSDLPIARRASLHRFLEKRKDRAVARAPYQVNQQPEAPFKASGSSSGSGNEAAAEPEPEPEPENEPETEEGRFPRHLDLNL